MRHVEKIQRFQQRRGGSGKRLGTLSSRFCFFLNKKQNFLPMKMENPTGAVAIWTGCRARHAGFEKISRKILKYYLTLSGKAAIITYAVGACPTLYGLSLFRNADVEMSRSWSSAHDWKSCIPQKGIESSNLSISANFSRQYRCRGLNAYGINCFRDFDTPKIQMSSNRCHQRFSRNWRGLNPWFQRERPVLAG